jgi:hypothetical protein
MQVDGHDATFMLDTGEVINYLQKDRAPLLEVQSLGRQARSGEHFFELGEVASMRLGSLLLSSIEIAFTIRRYFTVPSLGEGTNLPMALSV